MGLTYDYRFMPPADQDWTRAEAAYAAVKAARAADQLGFTKLPYGDTKPIHELAEAVRSEFKNVIVIGIGGSDLGARAVHRALNHQFYNLLADEQRGGPRLFFLGDTTDPVAIHEVLDVVDLQTTAVVIISKSGNTIEQMSTFTYLRQKLVEVVGEERMHQQIIAITDAEGGTLREIATSEGYRTLPVPGDVGGRFSVFSNVGLLVLAIAGIAIDELLNGARWLDAHDMKGASGNPMLLFALHQYLANTQHHQPISVLMPYIYSLRDVGFWYRQLWAESLGKRTDRNGQTVEVGPTPVAAVGPTDQHSQLQLYREGPRDKVVTFIIAENIARDATLPAVFPTLPGVSYLGGHRFAEILHAEQQSTAEALAEDKRPSSCLKIGTVDAFHIGVLLYFFELAVTYSGEMYNINAFDQPGVELSKNIMYGILGRPEYESYAPADSPSTQLIVLE